ARLSGWLRESSLGHFAPEPEGADQACQELLGLVLEGTASPLAAQAKEVLALADLQSTPSGAFKALVDAGRLDRHENLALIRLGLKRDFDPDVLAEAASLARNFRPDGEGRLDLTAVPTATVDALGAREYDDAISLEQLPGGGHRLGLHIADVAAMVPPGSLVDKWAAVQISSIYLPEGRRPMLPEALTEGLASLRAGEDKPAFSLLATLDAAGQILDYQFRPTLVRVDLQVSFPRADELLESGQGGILEPLESLSLGLLANRLAAGGQNLNLPHLNVTLNAEGRTEVWLTDDGSRSNLMVGEFMILANHLAARTLMEASVACPFRFQNPARPLAWNPPKPLSGRVELAVALASRRLVGRGGLSLEPLAHSGLGLGPYTSFTSPMRRYLDLLVARQLRAHSTGKAPAYSRQDMMGLALPADETQRAIRRMQNDRQRYWLAWHLAGQVGQDFVALVYDRRGRRGRLCITDLMLEVELPSLPDAARPGSDVILRLARSVPGPELPGTDRDDMLRFEFVSLA
ncbi:MAG: RNB domain-containing ribonuclease, partial [Deltaproteobacteria bacterium]|nr:RNB domain-containing ribonuclease [Deltaproteobacteria bacterium]